ncbi:hypothetical protein [Wolbachia endosymbiont of Aedes albopictus]|uniref:hypothetical protein n=1 Tax=Wolbachia endosymbiont of Aedes albopictus TaxID=167957 RepID=UPI0021065D1C|nr:hypothetical protein [Wolbachia endosymbiont of Aedes albopictus]
MWKFVQSPDRLRQQTILQNVKVEGMSFIVKIAFSLGQKRGEKFVERMLSIFLTSRLNNQNPVQKLQNLVAIPS